MKFVIFSHPSPVRRWLRPQSKVSCSCSSFKHAAMRLTSTKWRDFFCTENRLKFRMFEFHFDSRETQNIRTKIWGTKSGSERWKITSKWKMTGKLETHVESWYDFVFTLLWCDMTLMGSSSSRRYGEVKSLDSFYHYSILELSSNGWHKKYTWDLRVS